VSPRRAAFGLALALFAALGAAACTPDSPAMDFDTDAGPVAHASDPDAVAVVQGYAVAVDFFMVHEEVEGTSEYAVTDARADDPTVLSVMHSVKSDPPIEGSGSSESMPILVIVGLAPGKTTLHLLNDGSEVGSVPVEVVAQDP
jgi:hypothetical protein